MLLWAAQGLLLNPWLWAAAAAAAAFRLWYRTTIGMCRSSRRMDGRSVLVTGANAGIGLETARDLARRGARVLLACRDPERGQQAVEIVRAEARRGATVKLLELDLASLASVRACAAKVLASEPRLDVLINNAGAAHEGGMKSRDGLHLGIQVNHFGPFLLTLLLVDLLKKSAPSRIVFVSSILHLAARITPEYLDYESAKIFNGFTIYAMTKLANCLVSNELARRLRGTGVTVNSLHPGAVSTGIFRHFVWGTGNIVKVLLGFFCKSVEQGAQTTIHLAVSEEVEGVTGRYFVDCKETRMARAAYDEALARAVWEKSELLVGLQDHERPTFAA